MSSRSGVLGWLSVVLVCSGCGADTEPSAPVVSNAHVGAPCTREGKAFVDADGDGYAASDVGAVDCSGAGVSPPKGYTGLLGDCDDSSPNLTTWYLADEDGDGLSPSVDRTVCGPPDAVPAGAVGANSYLDCNDHDSNLGRWGRRDSDGDGYGASPLECLGTQLPQGYVAASPVASAGVELIDCDDMRADVHPRALELWSDALDTDCDGNDVRPEGCLGTPCSLPVETDLQCGAPDLVVLEFSERSVDCNNHYWVVVVANQGTVSVPGFSIRVEGGSAQLAADIPEALPPGVRRSYVLWGEVPADTVVASVSSSADDCRPSNNQSNFTNLLGSACAL